MFYSQDIPPTCMTLLTRKILKEIGFKVKNIIETIYFKIT
jgi:hypothetical protein